MVFYLWLEVGSLKNNKEQETDASLVEMMNYMQRWSHKLALSIESGNAELAGFYLHELEETTVDIMEKIPEYNGIKIGEKMRVFLWDDIEHLEVAIKENKLSELKPRFEKFITSCNNCHLATDFGHIVITPGYGNNPFNQKF